MSRLPGDLKCHDQACYYTLHTLIYAFNPGPSGDLQPGVLLDQPLFGPAAQLCTNGRQTLGAAIEYNYLDSQSRPQCYGGKDRDISCSVN